ncbi:MAG: sigma-54-dependent Fis family transcriptional regulator [Bacteroidetes bacterium]|nr:sigma-54-dependent Fis family transcriptional regulator [Bacteroidota bacterium]
MENKFPVQIFILEDDPVYAKTIQLGLEDNDNYNITHFVNGEDFLKALHAKPDIVTIDFNLPDHNGLEILKKVTRIDKNIIPLIISGQSEVEIVVQCYKNGAKDYIIKKADSLIQVLNSIKNLSANVRLRKEVESLQKKIGDRQKYYKIIGESKAILNVLRLIQKVEKTNMMVLVTGESGTGKELIGKAIHYNSPRKGAAYIAVNMAAIPEDLIESELFGHEKGAFTGAEARRIGKFEEANKGSLFLDEIGDMSLHLQTRLLRVLQEKKITRVGSNKEIELDVRVIAATNKNLNSLVKEGKFREDLYYRLQGFLITLPLLKERENDVIILAKYFLKEFCSQNGI